MPLLRASIGLGNVSEPATGVLTRRRASAQIQLFGDVPVGSARFADLARGVEGVGYRRSKIDFVSPVRPAVARLNGLEGLTQSAHLPQANAISEPHASAGDMMYESRFVDAGRS